ncbi:MULTISPECIES: NAD-dependent malic enzyme [Methylomonas]|uniref:NAD-dependent malic enzyme n=2 Tax=Methylomonas TaxID=416 RepID=A0A126T7K4_9GAMM|nr:MULTISPECIES: NAD-dependent malic enzyme [Methylomonas]AMK78052.1 NAD-dependent malic enzyme [Methylomonas denitrificans]OAI07651.1 NAD-dependent malic enzyme [Methylomonas methanica]TCV85587.1 malate dehydrogenase (oxaloacetate-decarboxylating) [Methylomonas methanica]
MTTLSDYFDYRLDADGNKYVEVSIRGVTLLRLPATNKGTAFNVQERIELGLDGLLPPQVTDMEQQLDRVYANYQKQANDISKYQFLRALQDRTEVLFYALLERHLDEMVPIVYTPTIGLAVQQFSSNFTTTRGLTFSAANIDRAETILQNYPLHDVRMIVVTDSSSILGIGDQGMGGLAICIGKLGLYTVGGGMCPFQTLPVNLDVGTNRAELLDDPFYLGAHTKRLHDQPYFELVDKFVNAVKNVWPKAIIQWEDFAKNVAFDLLAKYKDQVSCFNDDIQGTGAVALAGLLSACRKKGETLAEQTVVVVGAGAGGFGVATAIKEGMLREGLTDEQVLQRIFVIDAHGLVVKEATTEAYKLPLSHTQASYHDWGIPDDRVPNLLEVVTHAKPGVLLGLTGVPGLFSEAVVKTMARNHPQPIIFPLSNPTANCEATPEDILEWTQGTAMVATGSPSADVEYQGRRYPIGQGNNAFIFPGLGFAAVLGECSRISDAMVLESAYALADYIAENCIAAGLIFPPVSDLKQVSLLVATRVLAKALVDGSATRQDLVGIDLEAYVKAHLWKAEYAPFKYAGPASSCWD